MGRAPLLAMHSATRAMKQRGLRDSSLAGSVGHRIERDACRVGSPSFAVSVSHRMMRDNPGLGGSIGP
jgi:hypothetical protein